MWCNRPCPRFESPVYKINKRDKKNKILHLFIDFVHSDSKQSNSTSLSYRYESISN